MPLPKPSPGEQKEDWISRCMGDPVMVAEFPDQEQRAAVCITKFEYERIKNDLYRIWQG